MEQPRIETVARHVERALLIELSKLPKADRVPSDAVARAAEEGNVKRSQLESQGSKNEISAMKNAFTDDMRAALKSLRGLEIVSEERAPAALSFRKSHGSVIGPDDVQHLRSHTS